MDSDPDPIRCSECGTHFVTAPGQITDGMACPECGGRRLFRDQPSPTQSDGTLRNMVDSDTQIDQGGNPLGEGTIMGIDGERNQFKRDNFMHSKTESNNRPETFNMEPYDALWHEKTADNTNIWNQQTQGPGGTYTQPVRNDANQGLSLGQLGDIGLGVGATALAVGQLGLDPASDAAAVAADGSIAAEDTAAAAGTAESAGASKATGLATGLAGKAVQGFGKGLGEGAINGLMRGALGQGAGGSGGSASQAPGWIQGASFKGSSKEIPMMLIADFETYDSIPRLDTQQDTQGTHGFDQKEFTDGDMSPSNFHNPNLQDSGANGEDNARSDSSYQTGFTSDSPGIERAQMVMPLLMHYYHSEESGENDPIIKGLHEALERENPGYLTRADDDATRQLIDQYRSPSARGVHGKTSAGPANQLPGGMPTTGTLPGQPPINSVPQPQVQQGTCPNCGGGLGPDGSCPQCGNGNNGTMVPPMPPAMQGIISHLEHTAAPWDYFNNGGGPARAEFDVPNRGYYDREDGLRGENELNLPTENSALYRGDGPRLQQPAQWGTDDYNTGRPIRDDLTDPHALTTIDGTRPAPVRSPQPVDPWMDNEPGAMTFPPQWTSRTATHQGPVTPEQIAAVQEILLNQGRADECPNVPLHPEQYAKEMAEIQNTPNVAPQIDPSQLQQTPPPAMPSAPGGMPVNDPSQPGGGMPMQPMSSQRMADANTMTPRCPRCGSGSTRVHAPGDPTKAGDEPQGYCPSCNLVFDPAHPKKSKSLVLAGEVDLVNPVLKHDPHMKWADVQGQDLMPGQTYELHSAAFSVPTEIRIMHVKPDGLDVQLVGGVGNDTGEPDFKISRQEAQLEKYEFVPVNLGTGNVEPDNTPGISPEQVPPLDTTDTTPDVIPHTAESSVQHDVCSKCGSTAIDSRMLSPELTHYACVRCEHEWEKRDEDQGVTASVDLSWLNESGWEPSSREIEMMERSASGSRDIRDLANRDPRLQRTKEILEANRLEREANERTAGKNFSQSERRSLIDERGKARNLVDLDLDGTHYETRPDRSGKANEYNVDEDHFALGF